MALEAAVLRTATAEIDSMATAGQDPVIPIDVVRLESLPPKWQQRIPERDRRVVRLAL